MSEQSTFEKVKAITVDQLSVAPEDVKMDSTFIDDLGADSLDIVELIMAWIKLTNNRISIQSEGPFSGLSELYPIFY